jgi:hypothetical protein
MRTLRAVEIIFPTEKPSCDEKNRFPARNYMKTPAQIMMQTKQSRKETWRDILPELSMTDNFEGNENFAGEYLIP